MSLDNMEYDNMVEMPIGNDLLDRAPLYGPVTVNFDCADGNESG